MSRFLAPPCWRRLSNVSNPGASCLSVLRTSAAGLDSWRLLFTIECLESWRLPFGDACLDDYDVCVDDDGEEEEEGEEDDDGRALLVDLSARRSLGSGLGCARHVASPIASPMGLLVRRGSVTDTYNRYGAYLE